MNIGDRVRFIHSKDEGIIVKINDNKIIEVEIEDGFQIPVLRSEVTAIAADETRLNAKRSLVEDKKKQEMTRKSYAFAEKGIYLGFASINDKRSSLYLINNTDYILPFSQGIEKDNCFKGENAGVISAKNTFKIGEYTFEKLDKWGIFVFQFLFFRKDIHIAKAAWIRKMRFRAQSFYKNKPTEIPLLKRKGYLFQLDESEAPKVLENINIVEQTSEKINAQTLKEKMFESNKQEETIKFKDSRKGKKIYSKEVDLHIEELVKETQGLSNAEILQIQLNTFENTLENALMNGFDEVIFIHGVGKGILRKEIQKRLSQHSAIEYYEDAQKEKFGYGATKVKLKG